MRRATVWQRIWATTIDSLIVVALALPVVVLYLLGAERVVDEVVQGLGVLVGWIYYAGLESSERRATWGKRVLGLVVVDENGQRIDFGRASLRFFARPVSALLFIGGIAVPAFRRDRRALHDLMASTFVMEVLW